VTIKATNTTGRTGDINLEDVGAWSGPLALKPGSLSVQVTSVGATPASGYTFQGGRGTALFGLDATVYPKGHPDAAFTIPAHATFEWKVSVRVAGNWLVNDGVITVGAGFEEMGKTLHGHGNYSAQLKVGNGKTGGPVLVSIAGATKLAPGHPGWEELSVTNHTGARIAEPLTFLPQAVAFGGQVQFKLYQWVGTTATAKAHWLDITKSGFTVPGGLANNASAWFQVRVVSYTAKVASEQGRIGLWSPQILPTPQMSFEQVTVLR
jgi:hypothetical protein